MALISQKNKSVFKAMDKFEASGRRSCRAVRSGYLGCCKVLCCLCHKPFHCEKKDSSLLSQVVNLVNNLLPELLLANV
jgi:hypothetical protein